MSLSIKSNVYANDEVGAYEADIIYAGAGNDTIYADALDTIVTGGQGGDLIVLI